MERLKSLIPGPPAWTIDWPAWEALLGALVPAMAGTPQNPRHHGEGDVWRHTRLVCRALTALPDYRGLAAERRTALFLAALLHDVGKPQTTRLEQGRWRSPHHAAVGAGLARVFLWQDLGLSGTPEKQRLRETVCRLIEYHTLPTHAIDDSDAVRRLRAVASGGALCPGFSLALLCLLARADVLGRICGDQAQLLEQIALCAALAEEAGCDHAPFPFPTAHTRFAYLSGRDVPPEAPLYDAAWGPVLLLSGLPGTGKDTWIRDHGRGLPVISLDDIRKELRIAPTEPQGPVVHTARARARGFLRQRQPFVWNATNLTPQVRRHQLQLFSDYGAAAEIHYLETTWAEQLRRNRCRPEAVPEAAICRMLERLTPPQIPEAREVCWHTL